MGYGGSRDQVDNCGMRVWGLVVCRSRDLVAWFCGTRGEGIRYRRRRFRA